MPSKVVSPSPQIKRFHICRKGNKHSQQPLNLVCLDPICRNNPLICPTCFSQYHKYHKTIPLNEFISDYQGTICRNHKQTTIKRLNKQYLQVKSSLQQFRGKVQQKLSQYEQSIEQYFKYLHNSLNTREQLSNALNVTLDPKQIIQAHSQQQVQQSLNFIINYSLFNNQNRLTNTSSILKYDQSRTLALLDKVVNQNLKCQTQIQLEMKKLNFAQQTLNKQSLRIQNIVNEFNSTKLPNICPQRPNLIVDPKTFVQQQTFNSTLKLTNRITNQNNGNFVISKLNDMFSLQQPASKQKINQQPLFGFSNVYKNNNLTILDKQKQSTIKSNITALKPQYALICPSIDYQPQKQQNWSIKIKNCRNFASSKNTIAVGLCSLNQITNQNYEQNTNQYMKNQYMLTSEGYLIKNGREQKCNFTFSTGDVLDLKYDPYYKLLTIRKDNGRKVSIKVDNKLLFGTSQEQKLYACVRLTYASDQVQILNHIKGDKHRLTE